MSHRRIATVVAALCAASFVTVSGGASAAPSGAGRGPAYPDEPVAVGTGGSVASMDVGASRAGIDVLRRGGNAVDAAVATASALGVTVPFVAGPGGGGFMVIYNARTHTVTTIDGRETCPSACTTNLFVDPTTGQPMNYTAASDQPLSTGVPGNVATWATAVGKFGRLSPQRGPATGDRAGQPRVRGQLRLQSARTVRAARRFRRTRQAGRSCSRHLVIRCRWGRGCAIPDLAHTYQLIARRRAVRVLRRADRASDRPGRRSPRTHAGADDRHQPGHHEHEGSASPTAPGSSRRPG